MSNYENMNYNILDDNIIAITDTGYVSLEKNNPYLINNNIYGGLPLINYYIPDNLVRKAKQIQKMSCFVKFMCFNDLILSIVYFNNNWLCLLISLTFTFLGYISISYNKQFLIGLYIIYQYLYIIFKFVNCLYYLFTLHNKNSYPAIITVDAGEVNINMFIMLLLFIPQVFICYYIKIYYSLLPTKDDKSHINLKHAMV